MTREMVKLINLDVNNAIFFLLSLEFLVLKSKTVISFYID